MHILILMLIIVGVVWLLLHKVLSEPRDALMKVPLTSVAEAKDGAPCKLVGVVKGEPEQMLTTPFSARPALYFVASLQVYNADADDGFDTLLTEERGVEQIELEDDSGTARVRPAASGKPPWVVFDETSRASVAAIPMEQVVRFVESNGKTLARDFPALVQDSPTLPAPYRVVEEVMAQGDRVVAVGRARRDEDQLELTAARGHRMFLSNDLQAIADFARTAVAPKE